MQDFKITWIQQGRDGRRESVVSFDLASAEQYLPSYEARPGALDVRIVPVEAFLGRPRRRAA
ncbi:hypothetical protein [Streptomyces sp. NPDC127114]|uniref:hypothetical protein n=1 Tax=Streptomyces sp. NPDC127114 TaxID=3345366 RepID=UPI00363A7E24